MIEMSAGPDDGGRRLDRVLRKRLPNLPLAAIYRLLRQGRVRVNGGPARGEYRIRAGDRISLGIAPEEVPSKAEVRRPPDMRGLQIVLETADLLFCSKPAGLVVHGPASLDTLVQAYLAPARSDSLSFKSGPLHRLDQGTSGLIVFSKTLAGAQVFSALIRERRVIKRYAALVEGRVAGPAVWEDRLGRDRSRRITGPGAKSALTRIRPLAAGPSYSLILAEIHTGLTHQIRAQAGLHGHPLAGDRKYGGGLQAGGFLLHAWSLEFPPDAGLSLPRLVSAPFPAGFERRIQELLGY